MIVNKLVKTSGAGEGAHTVHVDVGEPLVGDGDGLDLGLDVGAHLSPLAVHTGTGPTLNFLGHVGPVESCLDEFYRGLDSGVVEAVELEGYWLAECLRDQGSGVTHGHVHDDGEEWGF